MRTETILVLETSLDDCSGQVLGYVLERALELGALDAYTVPAQMKKHRPGVVLTLLAPPRLRKSLLELLLRETSTLGVRIFRCQRVVMERSFVKVRTEFGPITVKVARGHNDWEKVAPEYDDCRAAARRHEVPLREVLEAARLAYQLQQYKAVTKTVAKTRRFS